MGYPDRPGQAHPGNRRPRGRCRGLRPPGAGGHRAVGRNAEGHRGGPRPAARARGRRPPRPHRAATVARHAGQSAQTHSGPGRFLLVGGRPQRDPRVPGRQRHPRDRGLPPPGAVRRHAGEFRGRPRRRFRSRPDRQVQGSRPDPRDRLAPGRRGDPGLYPAGHGRQRADRPGPARRRRDRPRVPPSIGDRVRPERLRARHGRDRAGAGKLVRLDAGTAVVARGAACGAELRRHPEPGFRDAGAGNLADPGCDRHHRCGQLRRLGDPIPQFQRGPALYRPDQRRNGLQRARRGRRQDHLPGPHGGQHGR